MAVFLCMMAACAAEPATEDGMDQRSKRIEWAFNTLTRDNLEILDEFYAPDVHFEDPLGAIEGLAKLKAYYAGMYENVQEIHFDFKDEVAQGDTHVVVWMMRMKVKGLNKGEEVTVDGNSVIRFNDDDLVSYHRDYFDVGAMVYEHVPVVRFLVKKIKNRLSHGD
ncbi:MAG: nuclear transport factor 2 family protein [Candidatus Hydrogenedentes bacterium]|nr:nuclear transport factor 2 family protein [Candidatus Hydrogenedentota bacterium]